MQDILAMGETVIDFTPIMTQGSPSILYECNAGGAPCNMVTAAAKLGAKCSIISIVGNDTLGEFLVKSLREASIDVQGMIIADDAPTVFVLLTIDEKGNRSYEKLQTKTVMDVWQASVIDYRLIDQCEVFHIAGAMFNTVQLLEAGKKAIEYAKRAKKLISCDINWRPFACDEAYLNRTLLPILPSFDILKVSREELEILSGTTDLETGVKKLYGLGVDFVVATLGEEGCYYCYNGGYGKLPTYDIPVLNTNASGDIFMGVMLTQLHQLHQPLSQIPQGDIEEILDIANAAGAICASKNGALSTAPNWEEIRACRASMPLLCL